MKKNFALGNILILLLFTLNLHIGIAQESQIKKANEKYEHLEYIEANKIYLKIAENGYGSEEVYAKLANSFYFNAQYDDAAKWYGQLFQLNKSPEPEILSLRYSQSLKAIGKDSEAEKFYDSYQENTRRLAQGIQAVDYLELIQQNSGRYDLKKLEGIFDNNKISYGHTLLNNTLYYASTEEGGGIFKLKNSWDGLSFLSIYEVNLDSINRVIGKPEKFKGYSQSKYHESSLIYTKDQKTLYFTRNNVRTNNKEEFRNLKIFRSILKNGKWGEPQELSINSDEFSTAHPALSPDEKRLYFASDRPGGFGESDLYFVEIGIDGALGEAQNLGSEINTSGRDSFPFISSENELYFSSDGHFGLGGLDVFYVKIKEDSFGKLYNVGEPINSYADDFSFGFNQQTKRGFISSDRTDQKGEFVHSNIYSFLELEPVRELLIAIIEGVVTDKHTKEPIENSTVIITNLNGEEILKQVTDREGYYRVEVDKNESYFVKAEKQNYDTQQKQSVAGQESQKIDFQLQSNKVEVVSGTDLAKVLNIPNVYFDFDKSEIRPDAEVELNKIAAVLMEFPKLEIAIRSHSDSRGRAAYNLILSQRRAHATLEYLVSIGIDRDRLTAEGLGLTELKNHCSKEVKCSDEEHEENRRSEFKIK